MIEKIQDEDEAAIADEKRTLSGSKKKSIADVSLELAKLHVSFIILSNRISYFFKKIGCYSSFVWKLLIYLFQSHALHQFQ